MEVEGVIGLKRCGDSNLQMWIAFSLLHLKFDFGELTFIKNSLPPHLWLIDFRQPLNVYLVGDLRGHDGWHTHATNKPKFVGLIILREC